MKIDFATIVEQDLKVSSMKPGALIKGNIIDVQKNWVIVDTHLKTESILPLEQFNDTEGNSDVHVGDEIELMLESVENGLGRTQVSYGKAKFWRRWTELEASYKKGETVKGLIKNRVRGGFSVFIDGIKGFLPGSLIEIGEGVNPAAWENTETNFKIVKISRSRFNVVLSHKSLSDEKSDSDKQIFFESLMEAGTVRGRVKKIMDFGAFIDLGKGEGLVYIADIMWQRIQHPSEVLKVGEEYEFKVINYNREKNRLSLSLREMQNNPWDELEGKIEEGQEVSGLVTKIDKYGFFVELAPGIVGLVHISEIDWVNKSPRPANYVKVGDTVNIKILSIDIQNRRISLGYKQCFNNPWDEYAQLNSAGDIVESRIKDIKEFGMFVELNEYLDGFIHANNIDWEIPAEEALKLYSKNDMVKAVITVIDVPKEKISLSIKKTKPNNFMDFIKRNPVKKTEVKCIVKSVDGRKVIVKINDDLDGIINASELGIDKMKEPADLVKVGEELTALIWRVDTKKRQIFLSLRAVNEQQDQVALDHQQKKKGGFFSTLGDILNLKDKQDTEGEEGEGEEAKEAKEAKETSDKDATEETTTQEEPVEATANAEGEEAQETEDKKSEEVADEAEENKDSPEQEEAEEKLATEESTETEESGESTEDSKEVKVKEDAAKDSDS